VRVLMVTQAVDIDHPTLGFTVGWVNALARRVDHVHVVTMKGGRADLTTNVTLHAYGPSSETPSRWQRWRFYNRQFSSLILGSKVDVVLVHMIPRWVLIAAPYVCLRGVPILIWFVHRQVTLESKIAHHVVRQVLTASPGSYRVRLDKVTVLGHGIDTELFSPAPHVHPDPHKVIAVGRVSPIKDLETLLHAADVLVNQRGQTGWRFCIVGGPNPGMVDYYDELKDMAYHLNLVHQVSFTGTISYQDMPDLYRRTGVLVNLTGRGSVDKVVLESLACGTAVVVCNRTFEPLLGSQGERFFFREGNAVDLARRLEGVASLSGRERARLAQLFRENVISCHGLDNLMSQLVGVLEASTLS